MNSNAPDATLPSRMEGNEVRVANGSGAAASSAAAAAAAAANAASRVVHGAGYVQAYQQAQLSHSAAMAANQAVANARALNGMQPSIRGQAMQLHAAGRGYGAGVAGYPTRVMNTSTPTAQKRAYPGASSSPYAPGATRNASALPGNIRASTPQKYLRTPNGRVGTNNFKNHLQAQDAATRYKAAYNNAGPAIVNIVENAAAYFEGKDTPEAIKDKERSFERYTFNADLLAEIFEGPVPKSQTEAEANDDKEAEGDTDKPTTGHEAVQRLMKETLLAEIGGQMLSRTYEDRMTELKALGARYAALELEHRQTEKSSMRLFQKVDRATSIEELRRVRAEYEKSFGVQFVEHPPLFEKRELDRSLAAVVQCAPISKIIQL